MTLRAVAFVAALASAVATAAQAEGLRPIQAQPIDLGEVSGIAYYTVERDGYHVVATLGQGEAGTPLRVETVLAPGQRVVLSTPRGVGAPPVAVEISREGDRLLVENEAATY